jgi:predicted metal-binding membrane protein
VNVSTLTPHRVGRDGVVTLLLAGAALAWAATAWMAMRMGIMPGSMGLGLAAFVGAWTLMMAAMMLPTIAPLARLYIAADGSRRMRSTMSLATGYLAVWAAVGVLAFVVARGADRIASDFPGWARFAAVGACVAVGLYQLTPAKERCLVRCRTPMGQLLRYRSLRGPAVDVRVGIAHGAWCFACCWALMVLLVVFGVMNLVAMALVTVVIVVEKVARAPRRFSMAVGGTVLALALVVGMHPRFAAGLTQPSNMPAMHTMMGGH